MTQSLPRRSLVIGASGQVGQQLARHLQSPLCSAREPPAKDWQAIDLANGKELVEPMISLLRRQRIGAIYCAAGATDVESCESDPAGTYAVNVEGPRAAARAARACGVAFAYFSTEYVFDGQAGPYTETASPNPLSVYGKSKLAGEAAVLDAHPEALVIRTTVVYGPDRQRKNSLYALACALRAGREFNVACDQYSTPTYNMDLASVSVALLESGANGVFNVVGPDLMSRLEFAMIAADALGLTKELIHGRPTLELGQRAPRPLRAGLTIDKLTSALPGLRMREPAEGINHWAAEEAST